MSVYVHVRICAFDPSTNARVHVNRQHNALSTITWITQVNILCVLWLVYTHLQQSDLCACPPKPHVRTCLHCLRLLHVCTCQSPTQALDNNLNESPFTWRCTYMSASALIQVNILCVHKQALCLCTFTTKYVLSCLHLHKSINGHVCTCQHMCLRPFK